MKPMRPTKATLHANLARKLVHGYFLASLEQAFIANEITALKKQEKEAAKR